MSVQSQKVAIITGANNGVGFETAIGMAEAGYHVVMACRSREKAETARTEMLHRVPTAELDIMTVDISDFASVRTFARAFRARYSQLDVLICNAGLLLYSPKTNTDGIELQFATNHLGHFLLCALLIDMMPNDEASRIVAVSSLAHKRAQIHFEDPTEAQIRLYERWAEGGAALSLIGEVQGDARYPEKPGNLVLNENSDHQALQSLATRGQIDGAHLWPQLGHAGALSHLPISKPKGPSPLDLDGLKCAGLSLEEVEDLPKMYAAAALQAQAAGVKGVHVHAGHGFLLSQFLSPLFNHRTDGYGGSIEARCRVVIDVINEVRRAVGPSYPVGVKINSTDKLERGLTENDALEAVRLLDQTSVDLIDVSGGTYFPGAAASSEGSSGGGPYFIDFARRAKDVTNVPIMLTGGFETRQQASNAVKSGAVDLVSLARAMVLNPQLASDWLTDDGGDPAFPKFDSPPRGGVTAWYSMRITALGEDSEDAFTLDPAAAMQVYEERDDQRCVTWREKFAYLGRM